MKDEIKEILDKLASKSAIYYSQMNSKAPYYNTDDYEASLLLDYITNLQKTNKNHSKKLIELGDKITNLQQKYDEANNAINWWSNKAKELQQENERLLKELQNVSVK